jgi:hypothetical protein
MKRRRYKDHQELVTPPQSPINSISSLSFFSSRSSSNDSPPRQMRNVDDLYEITNPIDD